MKSSESGTRSPSKIPTDRIFKRWLKVDQGKFTLIEHEIDGCSELVLDNDVGQWRLKIGDKQIEATMCTLDGEEHPLKTDLHDGTLVLINTAFSHKLHWQED